MQNLHHTEAEHCQIGMYDSSFEHDNCGIGAVVNIKGIKSHGTVDNALKIVENLEHRAGKDAEGGSLQPLLENVKAAELTRNRVYELAEYLK